MGLGPLRRTYSCADGFWMEVSLPPAIVVRQLFRQQERRKKTYQKWLDHAYEYIWKASKPTSEQLVSFSSDFQRQFAAAGAFDRYEQGAPERLRLKAQFGWALDAKVFWPVTFGLNFGSPAGAYVERMLMFTQIGSEVSRAKASTYAAPLCLSWTRHCLERLCKRRDITDPSCLEAELAQDTDNIAREIAVAATHGLIKNILTDDGQGSVAWVPYNHGILICSGRYFAAPNESQEMGFKFSFSKQRFTNVYVNEELFARDESGRRLFFNDKMLVVSWAISTFVSESQLTAVQKRYVNDFNAFFAALPPERIQLAYECWFNPARKSRQADRSPGSLGQTVAELQERIVSHLEDPAFPIESRYPAMILLHEDMSNKEFQKIVTEHQSGTTKNL